MGITKLDALKHMYVALGGDPKDCAKIENIADMIDLCAVYVEEHGGGGGSITVDDHLSLTSTNPVQNKVMTAAINAKADITEVQTDVNTAVEQAVPPAVNEGIADNTATQAQVEDAIANLDDL